MGMGGIVPFTNFPTFAAMGDAVDIVKIEMHRDMSTSVVAPPAEGIDARFVCSILVKMHVSFTGPLHEVVEKSAMGDGS